ncbi:DNA mismatch repair protein MutH [Bacillus luteolus]|nr:DNA mismatch repair protein MutH [Cytobacillus luteolus]
MIKVINLAFDKKAFQSKISNKLDEFTGLTFDEISYKININPNLISNKASIVTLVNRMFEYKSLDKRKLENEVLPNKLSIKTIRLQQNGKPKESMSFENVDFLEIINETWMDSKIRFKFFETVFLFIVFQYKKVSGGNVLIFKGIKLWQMPQETLDTDVKKLWETTKEVVSKGVEFKKQIVGKKVTMKNNLPGMKDNNVAHIRPKANDSNDKVELPDGQMITKQAYWLNNSYIEFVLKDIPNVTCRVLNKTKYYAKFPNNEINSIKAKLTMEVYPVEEFIIKVKQVIPSFNELDVNYDMLSTIDYKLDKNFVISKQLSSIDQYLDSLIFNSSYFQIPNNTVFQTPYVKRKLDNYENDYKLLKVEDNLYITNTSLLNGGVTKKDLIDYKNNVERFVEVGRFFTLQTLEEKHFRHYLKRYGFEDRFYESILMRPGRLKFLRMDGRLVFVKSKQEITTNDFIGYIFQNSESLTVDELIGRSLSMCNLEIDYDYAIRLMKNTTYFYSEDLLKLYEDKEIYYNELYK